MENWPTPLPLLTCNDGKFEVNPAAVTRLQKIEKPLIVVCIAGSYRTGKSYLMNRLAGQAAGFALGNTVESKTKGIWVWYLSHPNDSSKGLLVMDTEGLDDALKGDADNDMHILTLSILLSSIFIYNVMGKLDSSGIDKMDFVTEISKHIQVKTNARINRDIDSSFDCVFPHFVLVCRDAILDLEMGGEAITADEYLNRIMLTANNKATRDKDIKRNEIKMKLRRYFPQRKCFFIPRPAKEDEDMKRLEYLSEKDLKLNFLTESNAFCAHIYNSAPVKKLNNTQPITGKIFVHLAQIYADAINDGNVPCIGTALQLVSWAENGKLLDECLLKYDQLMEQLKLPLPADEFDKEHTKNHKLVVEHFAKKVFLDDSNEYHEKLQTQLQKQYLEFVKMNCKASETVCNQILDELFAPIQARISNNDYITPGGYNEFIEDMAQLQTKYKSVTKKGVLANVTLEKFLLRLQDDQNNILQADQKLTKAELKLEEERMRQEQEEFKCRIEQEKTQQVKQHEEALIKNHEEQIRSLEEAHKKYLEEATKHFEDVMEARIKEEKRLEEEKFKEEARKLREQIKDETPKPDERSWGRKIASGLLTGVGTGLLLVPHPLAKGAGVVMNCVGQFF